MQGMQLLLESLTCLYLRLRSQPRLQVRDFLVEQTGVAELFDGELRACVVVGETNSEPQLSLIVVNPSLSGLFLLRAHGGVDLKTVGLFAA